MPVTIDIESRPYKLFISSLKSIHTKNAYVAALADFMKYAGITTLGEFVSMERRKLQDLLIDFVIEQRKSLAYSSVSTKLSGVIRFCEMSDIELNRRKIKSFLGECRRTVKDRIYTREELQLLLQNSGIRTRVLILLLVSSGMRIGAVSGLCLKHLKKWDDFGVYQFTVYEKSREEYTTFCTSECSREIDAYLAHRKRFGERLNGESPLFRDEFDITDPLSASSPQRVTHESIRAQFARVLVSTGIRRKVSTKERKELMLVHSMRKYANTAMIGAGVNSIFKELLLGHSIRLDDAYFRPTERELLLEYSKAIPALTIGETTTMSMKIRSLEAEKAEEIVRLRDALTVTNDLVTEMRQEIEDLKSPSRRQPVTGRLVPTSP